MLARAAAAVEDRPWMVSVSTRLTQVGCGWPMSHGASSSAYQLSHPSAGKLVSHGSRQSTLRTSTGSSTPLRVSWRGSDSPKRTRAHRAQRRARDEDLLAVAGGADAGGDMHAAAAGSRAPSRDASAVWRPMRTVGAKPCSWRCRASRRWMSTAQSRPSSGPLEGDEEAVAGVLDLLAAVVRERGSQLAVVPSAAVRPRRHRRSARPGRSR